MRSTTGKTELLNKQKAVASGETVSGESSAGVPYIRVEVPGKSKVWELNQILNIVHNENPFGDQAAPGGYDGAAIRITDPDGTERAVDYRGQKLYIGYGYTTSAGNQYSNAPALWVVRQRNTSAEGRMTVELHCIERWTKLQHQRVMGDAVGAAPAWAEDTPIYDGGNASILKELLVDALGETIQDDTGGSDDGSANTSGLLYQPVLVAQVNDTYRAIIRRIMSFTGSSLRYEEDDKWHLIWTQDTSPSVVYTYTAAAKHPPMTSIADRTLTIPNRLIVADEVPDETGAKHDYTGVWNDTEHQAAFGYSTEIVREPAVGSNAEAADLAESYGVRVQRERALGAFVVSMNCFAEIFDYVTFTDIRSSETLYGWCRGITRTYEAGRGLYAMEVRLGGIIPCPMMSMYGFSRKSTSQEMDASAWPAGFVPPPGFFAPSIGGRADYAQLFMQAIEESIAAMTEPSGWPAGADVLEPPVALYRRGPEEPSAPPPGVRMPGGAGGPYPPGMPSTPIVDASGWPEEMQAQIAPYQFVPGAGFQPRVGGAPVPTGGGAAGAISRVGQSLRGAFSRLTGGTTYQGGLQQRTRLSGESYRDSLLLHSPLIPMPYVGSRVFFSDQLGSGRTWEQSLIHAGAILAQHIRADTIQTDHLTANCVVSAKIAADQILTAHIAADQIVSGHIAADQILTAHLSAGAVTSAKITSGQIIGKDFRTAENVGEVAGPAGIRFTATEVAGYSGGTTKQFYLQAADGKAVAGGGAVILDSGGITIRGQLLVFKDSGAVTRGYVFGSTAGNLSIMSSGSNNILISPGGTTLLSGPVTVNTAGYDVDFRVGGDTATHLLFVDAGNDRVGINDSGPNYTLDVNGKVRAQDDLMSDGNISLPSSKAYYVGASAGVSGSFTTADAKTVTVTKGIITSIA